MRVGLDRNTGAVLTGWDECAQSIGCIAETAIGSLVLNRDFASTCRELVDRPGNKQQITAYFTAIARALRKWEPGFRLSKVTLASLVPGRALFDIAGVFYPSGHLGDYSNPEGKTVSVAVAGMITVGG
jgi:phage baseplate assembly protein W